MTDLQKNDELIKSAFKMKENIAGGFLFLGSVLKRIRDEKAWEGQWESFDNPKMHNFVTELDIGGKSMVHHLIQIHQKFVEGFSPEKATIMTPLLLEAGWSKLALVAPLVHDEESAEEYAHLAAKLTASDLNKTLAEKKTGIAPESCEHKEAITFMWCNTCKTKRPV